MRSPHNKFTSGSTLFVNGTRPDISEIRLMMDVLLQVILSSLKFHFHTTLRLEVASEAYNHVEEVVACGNEADSEVLPH